VVYDRGSGGARLMRRAEIVRCSEDPIEEAGQVSLKYRGFAMGLTGPDGVDDGFCGARHTGQTEPPKLSGWVMHWPEQGLGLTYLGMNVGLDSRDLGPRHWSRSLP
jgi:hypothetical protein